MCLNQTNLSLFMYFVWAAIGTSVKSKTFRKKGFRAAHWTTSSFGNKRRQKAKATKKTSFSKFTQTACRTTWRNVG